MFLDIEVEYGNSSYTELFTMIAQKIMDIHNIDSGEDHPELGVVLTDDEGIRDINRSHRGIDKPTDVLSFPMYERGEIPEDTKGLILGDIVISIPTMEAQAREYGHSLRREMAFLFTHGLLHVIGYDHEDEKERVEMEEMQDKVLDELGISRDMD